MRHSLLIIFCVCGILAFNNSYSEQTIDIRGIYHYQGIDGSANYVTINRNGNNYILISISKEMALLSRLGLIYSAEIETLDPPIEEFAFSFSATEDGITLNSINTLELVVPFPNRTTQLNSTYHSLYTDFVIDDKNNLLLYIANHRSSTSGLIIYYKKIF